MVVAPELIELLHTPKKIVITSHQKPDGDALGSSLALYGYFKKLNHQVEVIYPTDFPSYYNWMPFVKDTKVFNKLHHTQILLDADLVFYLDFNSIDRIEEMKSACIDSRSIKVMIDHHLNPADIAQFTYSSATYASTAEMIFEFIDAVDSKEFIDRDIATCLYTGIVTDTGGFQFSSTKANTHIIAAFLLSKGIDIEYIFNNCYNNFSPDRLRLFGFCLLEKMVLVNKKVAYICITESEKTRFKIQEGDTEGLVNFPLKIDDIEIVALFKQDKDKIKISFRSKGNNDVNEIARKYFNGGGHKNAAGGSSTKSMEETTKLFEHCFTNQ